MTPREILYLALAEPIGLLISAGNPDRAKAALYQAKYRLADPALGQLQIRTSPWPDGSLVITNRQIELAEPPPDDSNAEPESTRI